MIGVRPDAKPWHPNGLAIDIDPRFRKRRGIALGDAIRDFALFHADRFGVQDVIWRGTYYTRAAPAAAATATTTTCTSPPSAVATRPVVSSTCPPAGWGLSPWAAPKPVAGPAASQG